MLNDLAAAIAPIIDWFAGLVAQYQAYKLAFSQWVGIDDWLLHTQSGMLIFLLAAIVTRRSVGAWLPLTVVVLAELVNEWFDRISYGSWRWEDTSRDLGFTLVWPLLLFLCTRTGLLQRVD